MSNTFARAAAIAALTAIAAAGPASATSWEDYSQLTTSDAIQITSPDVHDAQMLRTVSVVCPTDGYVVATADSGFDYYPTSVPGVAAYGYSITRDTSAPYEADQKHWRNVSIPLNAGQIWSSGMLQRADTCTAGQTMTFRFVAFNYGGGSFYAQQPRMTVRFFDQRI